MKKQRTVKEAINELRLLLAQIAIGFAFDLAPKGSYLKLALAMFIIKIPDKGAAK
ncbi:MAG TPA: hypothetical protein VF648_00435 [Pyrinomonadaceae bacterium]|jgi:hypothetical protein